MIRLLQIDGKIPNIALMRLAAHHRAAGDDVMFHHADSLLSVKPWWFDPADKIYASVIFSRSMPVVKELLDGRPDAVIGGTGADAAPLKISTLEAHGVTTLEQDYSIIPSSTRVSASLSVVAGSNVPSVWCLRKRVGFARSIRSPTFGAAIRGRENFS